MIHTPQQQSCPCPHLDRHKNIRSSYLQACGPRGLLNYADVQGGWSEVLAAPPVCPEVLLDPLRRVLLLTAACHLNHYALSGYPTLLHARPDEGERVEGEGSQNPVHQCRMEGGKRHNSFLRHAPSARGYLIITGLLRRVL